VVRHQMPLEHGEMLAAVEADQVVLVHGCPDRDGRLGHRRRCNFLLHGCQCAGHLLDKPGQLIR
jgi:hypothetical protein